MAAQTTNYQCPACTGPLHYDGASGKLACDYCGSSFTVEEVEAMFKDKNASAEKAAEEAAEKAAKAAETDWEFGSGDWGADASKMSAYNCTSCGAELVCDTTTAATECPYCGNPTIIAGKFTGDMKPEMVIPFKLDKKAAMDALRNHCRGKKLLPKVFTEENHIQKIQGVYVPFWLYNGSAHADVHFAGKQIFTHRQGNTEITETHVYDLHRVGDVKFENIPVDASEKMDDALMDSIEPYDYSELKPFSMSYMPGFLADRYDVTAEDCAKRADERAENTAMGVMAASTSGYVSVEPRTRRVYLQRGKVTYALMPVWMLTTKWGDKSYTFAMNGQTGKMVGDLPEDKSLYWRYRLMYTLGIGAAIMAAIVLISF